MQQAPAQSSSVIIPLSPQLPYDALYLVAEVSPLETRAVLARCNKWLHAACTPLLFREIYIRRPVQLVRLYESKKAPDLLSRTKSLYIEEVLFHRKSWEALGRDGLDYLLPVLSVTTTLKWLQIVNHDKFVRREDARPIIGLEQRLRSLSSDSTFLPELEAIIGTEGLPLEFLRDNRPVKYICRFKSHYHMAAAICPGLGTEASKSSMPYSTHLKQSPDLSASQVGALIREAKSRHPRRILLLEVHIRLPSEIRNKEILPIRDPISWMQEFVLAADLPFDELEGLGFYSCLELPRLTISQQLTVVEELRKTLPTLNSVGLLSAGIHWCSDKAKFAAGNLQGKFYSQGTPVLPTWTPRSTSPERTPEVINWWLDMLGLDFPDTGNLEQAEQTARQLRDAMCLRWDEQSAFQVEFLVDYLLQAEVWPVESEAPTI